jgi:hypothetical protein
MLVFPQFNTGVQALYPVMKKRTARTVLNELRDGRADTYIDAHGGVLGWEMHALGMTSAEASAIQDLFAQVAGACGTFTFLDPTSNLLAASENFSAANWALDPQVQVTAGIADPFGTTRASRVMNSGQTAQGLTQVLAAPGTFTYCMSAWVRSDAAAGVTLSFGTISKHVAAGTQWQRVFLAGSAGQAADGVSFGITLNAGASADVFGVQVEAQPSPGAYKANSGAGGLYGKVRFASDRLAMTARGTDVFDAAIRLVNTGA